MQRTPINLRNRNKSGFTQDMKKDVRKMQGKSANLDITFRLDKSNKEKNKKSLNTDKTSHVLQDRSTSATLSQMTDGTNEVIVISSTPAIVSNDNCTNMCLNEYDLKKMSLDEKFLLLLNRTNDVMKAYEELHETVIQYQKIITNLVKYNESLSTENKEIKEKLLQLENVKTDEGMSNLYIL